MKILLHVASVLLAHRSMAATLTSEKDSMMRREMITSNGEVIQAPRDLVRTQTGVAAEFCNIDFALGQEDSLNCTDANHTKIGFEEDDAAECLEAAERSHAKAVHGKFETNAEMHPRGCYKDHCKEAANNVCYFFNTIGPKPEEALKGFPVCKRPMLQNGSQDAHDGCPGGYNLIDDEETCREAANCWGYLEGTQFTIGGGAYPNASKNLDHPRGCFTDFTATHPTVYYNPETLMGVGTNVKGTPICNVTKTVKWPSTKAGADAVTATVSATGDTTVSAKEKTTEEKAADEKAAKEKAAEEKAAAEKTAKDKAAEEKGGDFLLSSQHFVKPQGPHDLVKLGTSDFLDEQLKDKASEYCVWDFPLGKNGTHECQEASHLPINRSITCMEAATRAGATVVRGRFEIKESPWMEKHPPGCFKAHCTESPIGVCYFYNFYGGTPGTNLVGVPVCKRDMIVTGTKDTDGPTACPANYQFIDEEKTCREAASCVPYAQGDPFLIGFDVLTGLPNASKHLEHPRGCFIDYTMTPHTVFYNPPNPMGTGTSLKGQVLCNVTKTVAFNTAEADTDTVGNATHAGAS